MNRPSFINKQQMLFNKESFSAKITVLINSRFQHVVVFCSSQTSFGTICFHIYHPMPKDEASRMTNVQNGYE